MHVCTHTCVVCGSDSHGDMSRILCVLMMKVLEISSLRNQNLWGKEPFGKDVMFSFKYLKVCHVGKPFDQLFLVQPPES